MPLRISRLGGTSLRKSFITNVYWAVMVAAVIPARASRGYHPSSASVDAERIGELRPAARAQPIGDRLALDVLGLAAVRADDLDQARGEHGGDCDRARHVSTRPG